MLKYLTFLFMVACGACGPAELETEDSSVGVTETEPVDPYPWADWEECGQLLDQNPCNFSLMDQHGEQVELYQHYGKVILLDFSAMWCGPCNVAAPYAETFREDYGEDNFIWITILIQDGAGNDVDQADLQAWAATHGLEDPILAATRDQIYDPDGITGYPLGGWPTMVIVDRQMILRYGIYGWSEQAMRTSIEGWL